MRFRLVAGRRSGAGRVASSRPAGRPADGAAIIARIPNAPGPVARASIALPMRPRACRGNRHQGQCRGEEGDLMTTELRFGILGSGNMARVYGDALTRDGIVPNGRLTAIALGT